jgi:hypothetical protein
MTTKAKSLEEIIRHFDSQRPLTPIKKAEWEAFYTETERYEIEEIITDLTSCSLGHKVLFGGHSGNGKSTELNKLVYDPKISEQFSVIHLDAKNILNLTDIQIVELLLAMFLKILAFADQRGVYPGDYLEKQFRKIEGFFRDELKIEEMQVDSRKSDAGVDAKVSMDAKLPLVKMSSTFFAKMVGQHESRETVRRTYRPRLSELTDLINELLVHLRVEGKLNPALLVIDGLDRTPVKQAPKLFVSDGQNVSLIREASMLLTVPISIIHSTDSALLESNMGPVKTLKNIRLRSKTNQEDDLTFKNRNIMEGAVLKRLADKGLITETALGMAVDNSGGVFRTLIDLVASAAVKSKVHEGRRIEEKDMHDAVDEARIKRKRPLNRKHWDILLEIHENKEFLAEMDDARLELLHGLFALEYINGGVWYDVNPLLKDSVVEYGEKYKSKKEDAP